MIEYALDPAPLWKPADRVRTSFKKIAGHWAIGIHAMYTKAGGRQVIRPVINGLPLRVVPKARASSIWLFAFSGAP
ncbi:hypothetical protein BCY88_18850 [Paraburkholderia fungorum]|uniref:Uncharacterized protein n=1 Tax=Paraburkholderia fungorum TaxID=134537 RepID=A0A3R7LCB6_9BURK|nr:hypothetical protein BCY88_18850 [Paraburkholderia fungorum]